MQRKSLILPIFSAAAIASVMTGCGLDTLAMSGPLAGASPRIAADAASAVEGDAMFTTMDDLDLNLDDAQAAGPNEAPPRHLSRSITQENRDGSITTRQYNPDGSEVITRKKGTDVVMEEDFSAPVSAQPSYRVPAGSSTELVTLTVKRTLNGSSGGGKILRSLLAKHIVGMQSDIQLVAPNGDKATRDRLVEDYVNNKPGHTHVATSTKRGSYVMDTTLDRASGVVRGIGRQTKADGSMVDIQTVVNPDKSHERITDDQAKHQLTDLKWKADRSGNGVLMDTSTQPPTQLATMSWDSSGKGAISYANGQSKAFKP